MFCSGGVFVDAFELVEVEMTGAKYTYSNGQRSPSMSKIDRFLISTGYLEVNPYCVVQAGNFNGSDHRTLVFTTICTKSGPKPFKIDPGWLERQDLIAQLKEWWTTEDNQTEPGYKLFHKIKELKKELKVWKTNNISRADIKITNLHQQISELELLEENEDLGAETYRFKGVKLLELEDCLKQEDNYWRLRSQRVWSNEGERCTRYFHLLANQRYKYNSICNLFIDGVLSSDHRQITNHISEFYECLYKESDCIEWDLSQLQLKTLSSQQSALLDENFTEQEVFCAIKESQGSKAPGPDGIPMSLFLKCWEFMREDIMEVVSHFHSNSFLNWRLNCSSIVLIPKVTGASKIEKFRPISLLNSIYKVISKCMENRLKKVLHVLVSEFQGASMENRSTLESILMANELVDSRKRSGQPGYVLKIDFIKAFDTINWKFIDSVFKSMGFSPTWRKWIQICLSSARMSVLINGSPVNFFKPGRGVRQGDPLSPMIFILCTEVLTQLVLISQSMNLIKGFKPKEGSDIEVPILQFADDTILMCGTKKDELITCRFIFSLFEMVSGLQVSYEKSCLFPVGEVDILAQSCAKQILKCRTDVLPTQYLGAPLGAPYKCKHVWNSVLARMDSKLGTWKRKYLSKGGRLQLIQSTLNSIPVHMFSCFVCPKSVLTRMERLIKRFYWGETENKRKIHTLSWSIISRQKKYGGTRICDLSITNRSLLTKWLFRFHKEQHLLWGRIIKAKYNCEPVNWIPNHPSRPHGSSLWRGISDQSTELMKHVSFSAGSGEQVMFWQHCWAGDQRLKDQFPHLYNIAALKFGSVAQHIVHPTSQDSSSRWELHLNRSYLNTEQQQQLTLIREVLPAAVLTNERDQIFIAEDDVFNVSKYKVLLQAEQQRIIPEFLQGFNFTLVWKLDTPMKLQCFLLEVLWKRLSTQDKLKKMGYCLPSRCPICQKAEETSTHLFEECTYSRELWTTICTTFRVSTPYSGESINILDEMETSEFISPRVFSKPTGHTLNLMVDLAQQKQSDISRGSSVDRKYGDPP